MPSIPQSLLWISLVALWLFVLVPMLISKRDAVRRTSDVALATRVLNSSRAARLRRRGGPAAGHRSDPDWRPSNHDLDGAPDDLADEAPGRSVVMVAPATDDGAGEPDYLDVDVGEDSGALPLGAIAVDDEPVVVAESDAPTLGFDHIDHHIDDIDDVDDDDADDDADMGEYEYVADSISASRRRRYESTTAEAVTARKYRFRARTLTVLAVLVLASAVAAFTWSSDMWWVCGSVGVVGLLYLAYLRRQTRIEERVRRRRAQRIARSRLGVENTADQEFDVVPSRLRRPGAAVLEIDEEDPEFEHLDYVPFARHYDLPRAAGQ